MPSPIGPGITRNIGGKDCWDEDAWMEFDTTAGDKGFRQILCLWADALPIVTALRGGIPVPGQAPSPAAFPDDPQLHFLSASAKGVDGDIGLTVGVNGMVAHKYMRLTCQYGSPTMSAIANPPPPGGGGFTPDVLEVDFECDVMTVPAGYYKFANGNRSHEPMSKIIPCARLIIPQSSVQNFQGARIFRYQGCVNDGDFHGSDLDKCLFLGAPSKQRFLTLDLPVWDFRWNFKVRGNDVSVPTFNQGYDVITGRIQQYDIVDHPFARKDFSQMFP
jgi:hypothetical protein